MFVGDVDKPRRNDRRFHSAQFCKEKTMSDTAINQPKKMSETTRQERAIIIASRIAIAIMSSAMCTAAQMARAMDEAAHPEDAADLDGVPAGPESLAWPDLDDAEVCYGCN
jgi:hypothetical protein